MARILAFLKTAVILAVAWLVLLAVLTGQLFSANLAWSVLMVTLAGCFLVSGPLGGACAALLLGLSAEAFTAFPAGRLAFAAAMVGLIMLHLSRIAQWSSIGRGFVMCSLGGLAWQLLLEFYQLTETGTHWSGVLRAGGIQAAWAGACWLIAAVLISGVRIVWKEAATRPVRFGSNF